VDEPALRPGLNRLAAAGYQLRVAPHVYHRLDYLAGSDEERLEDLHAMFRDKSIHAILCARGGYGTLRLLQKIDYDMIKERPKIVVGFSDITALLTALYERAGLVTFHGPTVRELASGDDKNFDDLLGRLSSRAPLRIQLDGGVALRPGHATGTLLGGNLSLLTHLIGTPFFPSLEGSILFFEDRGEPLYRIDRMLTHLCMSGRLRGLSAVILGQFEECGDVSALESLVADRFSDFHIPIVTGLPVGHGRYNRTLPIGLSAELDTDEMTLSISEGCFAAP
jgi:muramoyltetrapeptide carboxypeptidase